MHEYSSFSSVEHGTVSARHTPHIRSNQVISSPDVAPVTHARCLTHSCSRASHIRKTDIGHKGPYARCHGSAAATYCSPLLRYSSAECEIATEEREIMGVGSNAVCVVIVCRAIVLVRISLGITTPRRVLYAALANPMFHHFSRRQLHAEHDTGPYARCQDQLRLSHRAPATASEPKKCGHERGDACHAP